MSYGYWIKIYHEILDSPKVGLLPDATKWRYIACLVAAGETGEGGFLPDIESLAWRLRTNAAELDGDLSLMARRGLAELRLDSDGEERWFMVHFTERQRPMTDAERVKRHRKANAPSNASRHRNADVTKRYTEVEAEAEAEQKQIQKQKQQKDARPRVAAAAAPTPVLPAASNALPEPAQVAAAAAPDEPRPGGGRVLGILEEYGIALNQTTAGLLTRDPTYVEAHFAAAARRGDKPGLAIRRILDGDEVPRPPGQRNLKPHIPPELADVIRR